MLENVKGRLKTGYAKLLHVLNQLSIQNSLII